MINTIEDIIHLVLQQDADLAPITPEKEDRLKERLFNLLYDLEVTGRLKLRKS